MFTWARQAYQVSERRAGRGFAIHRAMIRYRSVKPDGPRHRRLHELAKDRLSIDRTMTIYDPYYSQPLVRRRGSARDDSVEIRTSIYSGETNSETQPWVMLGLLGHPYD